MSDSKLILQAIGACFDDASQLIDKIEKLKSLVNFENDQYKQIAMPSLYALIERFATSRYPNLSSSHRFKKLLLAYSGGKSKDLAKIDMLFLSQWVVNPDNSAHVRKEYKKIIVAIYPEIKSAFIQLQLDISGNKRFIEKNDLYKKLISVSSQLSNDQNFTEGLLGTFNCCEVIYHYGRCTAVHEGDFSPRGFITVDFLLHIARLIVANLRSECLSKLKLPSQLATED